MSNNLNDSPGGVVVLILLGILIGVLSMGIAMDITWKANAAKTECAQFNPTTGDFEWVDKNE